MPRSVRFVVAIAGMATLLFSASTAIGAAAAPRGAAAVAVSPSAGDVVGVGAPVTVTFAEPVRERSAAERSISFAAGSTKITPAGSFTWLRDDVLQWTPTDFWPAHSTISVLSDGFSTSFETGSAVVGVADLDAYTFTVSIDGQVAREMPASMGKSGFRTPIGTFTALEKQDVVVMDSRTIGIPLSDPEGYKLTVYDAVRVTWGGVYVHGAPWSTGSQGNSNVSHGCINLSPDNADWYYNTVRIGDPIIVQA
nr:L,D-transpeptidase [Mycolicibacterium sp. CAU 1645]